jgi:diguanylate cyclase (GGDEF)-like protein/PAS domain S-box-containing protein
MQPSRCSVPANGPAIGTGTQTPRLTPEIRENDALAGDDASSDTVGDRFNATFDHSAVGTAMLATSGEFLHVNRALCDLTGYRAEDLLGMNFRDVSHPDDLQLDADELQALISGHSDAYQIEKRFYHRRGPTLWVSLSVSVMREADGQPTHLLAQVVDITTARAAEASLRDANSRLQAILENVPAWISLRGMDGRYLDANQQLADIYGTTKEDLIGHYPADLRQSQATTDVVDDDRVVWETGQPVERELDVTYPDGTPASYHTVRYPVFDQAGEIIAIGSFAMDVSDRKRADQLRDTALAALEEAQEIAQVGSWRWDAATDTAEWSRELKRMFGLNPEGPAPVGGTGFFDYVVREDRRKVAQMFRDLLSGGPMSQADFRVVGSDGIERSVQALAHADHDHPGLYTGTVQDVTAARAIERDIHLAQERFRRAFEYAPVGMVISEPTGRSVQVNGAMCQMLGYSREELLKINASQIIHPDDLAERAELLRQLLDGEIDSYQREDRMLRSDGNTIWVSRHINLLRNEDGEVLQVLTQVIDITERRRMEKELRHLADHDPLTGLLNRRGLEVELERHVAHVNRYGARGALLVLDLDHFKVVNDTLGHEAGDRLIVAVAQLLRGRLRESDAVARLGGDEFAVLLSDATTETAEYVAGAILNDIQINAAVSNGTTRRHVSASIGVTILTQGLVNGDEVLVNADLAMYDAKEAGRGRVVIHSGERPDTPRMKTRISWMERIRSALDQERFTVYGQPIMGLLDGSVDQYELLLRMIDENGEVIPPGAFLYVAERYDLVQDLDQWVFQQAVRMLETQGTGIHDTLAINVSGKSLESEQYLEMIEAELKRSKIEPERLTFEVTETAAIANIAVARNFAERLQHFGCRFALDDFGAGFGSFYYLKHIPFDYLKIDREFVTHCLGSRTDQLVIESLVSIARGLDKHTVAEGVEDQETQDFLRRNGVDYAQGYHIGRPGPLTDGIPPWHTPTPISG